MDKTMNILLHYKITSQSQLETGHHNLWFVVESLFSMPFINNFLTHRHARITRTVSDQQSHQALYDVQCIIHKHHKKSNNYNSHPH